MPRLFNLKYKELFVCLGFIFIAFGSLLINITENGETFTNVTLKISGFFALIIGLKFIFPNMGLIKSKK